MYWRCHFQNLIELKPDSTYEFIYLDDTQMKTTHGRWEMDATFVVLTPNVIPDTIQITEVLERSNKPFEYNIFSMSENFRRLPGLEVICYLNGNRRTFKTDSIGEFSFKGRMVDSFSFLIKGRELKVIPKKKKTPSVLRISVDSDYKDLVYQQFGTNQISIQNGRMMVQYRHGESAELKTEYFEKIE